MHVPLPSPWHKREALASTNRLHKQCTHSQRRDSQGRAQRRDVTTLRCARGGCPVSLTRWLARAAPAQWPVSRRPDDEASRAGAATVAAVVPATADQLQRRLWAQAALLPQKRTHSPGAVHAQLVVTAGRQQCARERAQATQSQAALGQRAKRQLPRAATWSPPRGERPARGAAPLAWRPRNCETATAKRKTLKRM